MLKTSIVKWEGTQVDLVRADDPAGFALKVLSLGLLGVTVGKLMSCPDLPWQRMWSFRTPSGGNGNIVRQQLDSSTVLVVS